LHSAAVALASAPVPPVLLAGSLSLAFIARRAAKVIPFGLMRANLLANYATPARNDEQNDADFRGNNKMLFIFWKLNHRGNGIFKWLKTHCRVSQNLWKNGIVWHSIEFQFFKSKLPMPENKLHPARGELPWHSRVFYWQP
jgi:hypothetical protein